MLGAVGHRAEVAKRQPRGITPPNCGGRGARAQALERRPHLDVRREVAAIEVEHVHPAALVRLEEPVALERAQRLPERCAAHVQPLAELVLDQMRTRGELTAEHHGPHQLGHPGHPAHRAHP